MNKYLKTLTALFFCMLTAYSIILSEEAGPAPFQIAVVIENHPQASHSLLYKGFIEAVKSAGHRVSLKNYDPEDISAIKYDKPSIIVDDSREIPDIKSMGINALWIIPDEFICQESVLKRLLQECLKNKIPVIGLSKYFVRSGTLFAATYDYEDIGVQAGEIASEIINGKSPKEISAVLSRKSNLFINLNVARLLGVKIPDGIINKAKGVFGR